MKFRIIKYYDRYVAQVLVNDYFDGCSYEGEWENIGSPNGYYSVEHAKNYCKEYKGAKDSKIVELFEL